MSTGRAITLLILLVGVILGGTVFFHFVEGWGWVDAYFFTVVTLSTVGYGSLVPVTVLGKIGTTIFIFVGLGIFALAIQQFGAFAVRQREAHTEWLVGRLRHGPKVEEDEQEPAANLDTQPDGKTR